MNWTVIPVKAGQHRKLSASPLDFGNSTLIVLDTIPECVGFHGVVFKLHENPLERFKGYHLSSGG